MTSIQQIVRPYQATGFWLHNILGDGAFEFIRNNLGDMVITLNIASRNKHLAEIKRYLRTTKERARATVNSLPFKKYPPRLIAEMVYNIVFWLNSLPYNAEEHATISPRTNGTGNRFNKHCRIAFGTYLQMHEEGDNFIQPRTSGEMLNNQPEMNKGDIFSEFTLRKENKQICMDSTAHAK